MIGDRMTRDARPDFSSDTAPVKGRATLRDVALLALHAGNCVLLYAIATHYTGRAGALLAALLAAGGRVIASGTPEEVAANPKSVTGKYLQPLLGTAA